MRVRQGLLVAVSSLVLLAAAITPTAGAREPGVFVDPSSPSGKQYAIPLEAVRRDAAAARGGRTQKLRVGDRSAPPFGVGAGRSGQTSEIALASAIAGSFSPIDAPIDAQGGSAPGDVARGEAHGEVKPRVPLEALDPATTGENPPNGAFAIFALAGLALAVGLLLGVVARRRRTRLSASH